MTTLDEVIKDKTNDQLNGEIAYLAYHLRDPEVLRCAQDLDAVRAVETTLTGRQWANYVLHLNSVPGSPLGIADSYISNAIRNEIAKLEKDKQARAVLEMVYCGMVRVMSLSARQRTESLLWVLAQPERNER
jgi:hypothetical protein